MAERGDVTTAFLVVTVAGLSTCVGAALVFFRSVVSLANPRFLAASLAGSAGVMLYVSFVEIFNKASEEFALTDLGDDPTSGTVYALSTSCFFGGMLLTAGLRVIVHRMSRDNDIEKYHHGEKEFPAADQLATDIARSTDRSHHTRVAREEGEADVELAPVESGRDGADDDVPPAAAGFGAEDKGESRPGAEPATPAESSRSYSPNAPKTPLGQTPRELQRMGLLTALAIGLHNFPEGIATFVATLADPKVGIALGVAIAIHNIPEVRRRGLWRPTPAHGADPPPPPVPAPSPAPCCVLQGISVAIPVFYATRSRKKAFLWATLTGVSEPIGALIAYLVLTSVGGASYGVVFGARQGTGPYTHAHSATAPHSPLTTSCPQAWWAA